MRKHIDYLVLKEERPFSFGDFSTFEVDGRQYHMSRGTFRNKVSDLSKKGVIEVAYYSSIAFYTIKGVNFSKQILKKTEFTKALDSKQLESRIEAACSDNKIKLLIVDSIINHYSAEYSGRSKLPEKMQRLNKYMHLLLKTASSNAVAVVITNHQTLPSLDGFDTRVIPLGGNVMSHVSKYIIHLEGRNNDRRRARLERSPSHPQSEIYFAIDERRGFTDSE